MLPVDGAPPRAPGAAWTPLSEGPDAPLSVRGFFVTGGAAPPMHRSGAGKAAGTPSSTSFKALFEELFLTALRTSSAPGFLMPAINKSNWIVNQTHTKETTNEEEPWTTGAYLDHLSYPSGSVRR